MNTKCYYCCTDSRPIFQTEDCFHFGKKQWRDDDIGFYCFSCLEELKHENLDIYLNKRDEGGIFFFL